MRDIDGILLLDKPRGLSSNQALQKAKRLFGARKAGHTGTLDPLATGMLVICFGQATKISTYLLGACKRYHTVCKLGAVTDTGDSEGEIVERFAVEPLAGSRLDAALAKFTGEIEQTPPMYSALKRNGQPLYRLARRGVTVEREPRRVTIESLQCVRRGEDELELDVVCSKGTYVRTLVEDIGKELGCGAHVSALRRLGVEPYLDAQMASLDELTGRGFDVLDARLLPLDSALSAWPALRLSEQSAMRLGNGMPVRVEELPQANTIRLYDERENFIGIGHVLEDGRLAPKRMIRLK